MFKGQGQKGITLIALVITIIVLLILAGVSIAMLAGNDGVLTRASDSKIVNEIGAKKDAVNLTASEALTDYFEKVYVGADATNTFVNADLVKAIKDAVTKANLTNSIVKVEVSDTSSNTVTITAVDTNKNYLKSTGTIGEAGGITWVDEFQKK